ncbi:uncharacterized protein F4807DRAFT_446063 [Annulohypoxylon truncatum]|uniref:uncharacterized protein n=1 Tax=Annulohypoxylon truncatum TaxID=327061 RepID=UPI002007DB2D|nr:uncharacterized protein F4807DRAFT_446063 [Annulohypoxylon truncatum]KAI1204747.1 hypothetical protein F4807DRAFT_446063 [Annulohypoxylon truncatum]
MDVVQHSPEPPGDFLAVFISEPDSPYIEKAEPYICETCRGHEQVTFCTECGLLLCPNHWLEQGAHRPGRGINHEKSDPRDAKIVYQILKYPLPSILGTTPREESIQLDSSKNMWFGVTKNEKNDYMLGEGSAYHSLLLEDSFINPLSTHPCMVSFVGDTGVGKSALINLLIKFSAHDREQATPIVGKRDNYHSTSADVHLYNDPSTIYSPDPLLYADCEGMHGGENPIAAASNEAEANRQRLTEFKPRKVEWEGSRDDTKGRQGIASNLYPRILYIFSDVIIYVIENRRRHVDAFYDLINWAHYAMEQSYNKPVLPHVVLAFNRSEDDVELENEDSERATRSMMDNVRGIYEEPKFRPFLEYWNKKNKKYMDNPQTEVPIINSGEALLRCYYAKITVVHFSNQKKPTRLRKQTEGLYRVVKTACEESHQKRAAVGMKMNAAKLPLYVRTALNQFGSSLDKPFDFSEAWFELNPVSFEFSSTIFTLAKLIRDLGKLNGMRLWCKLGDFVASCFYLNIYRNNMIGVNENSLRRLWPECKKAAGLFWHKFWPCTKTSDVGSWPCSNGPDGHQNHQYKNGKGHDPGKHSSSHSEEDFLAELEGIIGKRLEDLMKSFSTNEMRQRSDSISRASEIHQQNVNKFYGEMEGIDHCISHSACLWCLDQIPEHPLPCGHVICSSCLMAVAKPLGRGGFFWLESCPLASHKSWEKPWIGVIKPNQAGIRMMSLDGGGIRGVMELEILMKIQKSLGGIPISEFFDLLVGTSAGGIIALGLGPGGMGVEKCKEMFEEFSKKAFSTPRLSKLPLIGRISQFFFWGWNRGKFQTEPLETAFKDVFATDLLFGGTKDHNNVPLKVAVTTTTQRGRVVVLSNYNRKSTEIPLYHFQRPELPKKEILLWEAARATSAAPLAFEPFSHTLSGQKYVDGALYHNNPVIIADIEGKAIWPDSRVTRPDILLSLGTGSERRDSKTSSSIDTSQVLRSTELTEDLTTRPYFMELARFGYDHLMNSMDCDQIWHQWLQIRSPDTPDKQRYRRINVTLDDPIQLDAFNKIDKCCEAVEKWYDESDAEIQNIADQLIASCFFYRFDQSDIKKIRRNGEYECIGTIECRLLPGKGNSLSKLGNVLKGFQQQSCSPKFVIQEAHNPKQDFVIISDETLSNMIENGEFLLQHTIRISHELAETEVLMVLHKEKQLKKELFPISGFPRKLQEDHQVVQEDTSLNFIGSRSLRFLGVEFRELVGQRFHRLNFLHLRR